MTTPPDVFVIVVSGWRGAGPHHEAIIAGAFTDVTGPNHFFGVPIVLRHGKCKYGGVDLIADGLAREWGWGVEEFPAEERNGKILGPQRNRRMFATEPTPHLLLAFPGPGSTGTWDALRWAQRYDVPFRGYPLQLSRKVAAA